MIVNNNVIYPRLREKMAETGCNTSVLSRRLCITRNSLWRKLEGTSRISLEDAIKIRNIVAPGEDLEKLFSNE